MRDVVANQVKQRKAVSAVKERLIRASSTSYGRQRRLHLVYVAGEPYIAGDAELAALRRGDSPTSLDLPQPADENEPFDGYP